MTADEIFEKAMKEVAPLPCQESYIRELASIFSFHIKKNALMDSGFSAENLPVQGGLVVSPTGSGKTFLFRAVAKVVGINTIIIDCSSLSRDGWKGTSLSQQLIAAKNSAEDRNAFEKSILFFDEVDKMKLYNNGHDEGNPMDNLLQLYNGGKVVAEGANKEIEYIDVSRFTIILGGAFSGLEDIILNRLTPKKSIGFATGSDVNSFDMKKIMHHAIPDDLEKYGLKKELLARIGSIISIDPMEEKDYECLLSSKDGSIKSRYNNFFLFGCGVKFDVSKSAISHIAHSCSKSKMGARAVNPIINDIMRQAIVMVDRDKSINSIILDAGDDGCFLTYEHGPRYSNAIGDSNVPCTPYYLTAKSLSSMVTKICELYRKSGCDLDYADEFKYFVNTSLMYLHYHSNPSDFCYESLQKLARTTGKTSRANKSTFDVVITQVIDNDANSSKIKPYYEKFEDLWNQDTIHRLNKALTVIIQKIRSDHRSCDIKFRLESNN